MKANETRQIIIESFLVSNLIDEAERDRLLEDETADVELAFLPVDSLKIVDLCIALESRIKREVQVEELIEHDSLSTLASHLASAG